MITGQEDTRIPKNKRPGPKRSPCPHCGLTDCSHCRCPGTPLCCHEGKMCTNHRYRRRLVCNPCEKNRIKYQTHYATSMKSHADDTSAVEGSFLCGSVPDPLFQDVLDNESEQYENGGVLSGSYTNSNDFSQQCSRASSMDMSMESHSFSHANGFMPMPSINEVGNDALSSINSFPCSPENSYTLDDSVIHLPPVNISPAQIKQNQDYKHRHIVYICTAQNITPFGYIFVDPNNDSLRYVRKYIEQHYADEINRSEFVFVNLQGHVIMDDKESKTLCWKETELRKYPCMEMSTNTFYPEFRCLSILTIPKHISEQIQSNVARLMSPPLVKAPPPSPLVSSSLPVKKEQMSFSYSPMMNDSYGDYSMNDQETSYYPSSMQDPYTQSSMQDPSLPDYSYQDTSMDQPSLEPSMMNLPMEESASTFNTQNISLPSLPPCEYNSSEDRSSYYSSSMYPSSVPTMSPYLQTNEMEEVYTYDSSSLMSPYSTNSVYNSTQCTPSATPSSAPLRSLTSSSTPQTIRIPTNIGSLSSLKQEPSASSTSNSFYSKDARPSFATAPAFSYSSMRAQEKPMDPPAHKVQKVVPSCTSIYNSYTRPKSTMRKHPHHPSHLFSV